MLRAILVNLIVHICVDFIGFFLNTWLHATLFKYKLTLKYTCVIMDYVCHAVNVNIYIHKYMIEYLCEGRGDFWDSFVSRTLVSKYDIWMARIHCVHTCVIWDLQASGMIWSIVNIYGVSPETEIWDEH